MSWRGFHRATPRDVVYGGGDVAELTCRTNVAELLGRRPMRMHLLRAAPLMTTNAMPPGGQSLDPMAVAPRSVMTMPLSAVGYLMLLLWHGRAFVWFLGWLSVMVPVAVAHSLYLDN